MVLAGRHDMGHDENLDEDHTEEHRRQHGKVIHSNRIIGTIPIV